MKRHRADLVSLFFGLFFAAVAAVWALSYFLDVRIDWNVPNLGWIAAAALILIGLLGVVASLRGERQIPPPVEPPAADTARLPPVDEPVDDLEPVTVPDVEPPAPAAPDTDRDPDRDRDTP